jgi:hypothetical protein
MLVKLAPAVPEVQKQSFGKCIFRSKKKEKKVFLDKVFQSMMFQQVNFHAEQQKRMILNLTEFFLFFPEISKIKILKVIFNSSFFPLKPGYNPIKEI